MSSVIHDKAALRRQMRETVAAQSTADAEVGSRRLCDHLTGFLLGTGGKHLAVAAFACLPGEPELMPLLFGKDHPEDLSWHLPRVEGEQTLQLHRVTSPADLVPGRFGIREPDPSRCPAVPAEKIDLFLVPGLGFDPESGHRLGRGKGYYDSLLASARADAVLVGVGFDRQIVHIPSEPHDVPLTHLCTESGSWEIGLGK